VTAAERVTLDATRDHGAVRMLRSFSSAAIARTLDPLGTHYFDCQKLIVGKRAAMMVSYLPFR
jgi:hypothetical protein